MSFALENQVKDLEEKLAISEQNAIDFERIAKDWKKGYTDLEKKSKAKIKELEQTIEELEKDLKSWRNHDR